MGIADVTPVTAGQAVAVLVVVVEPALAVDRL